GGLRQEVVERTGDVGEEIDQELEWLVRELGEVRTVEVERREVGEVLGGAVERAQHLGRGHAAGEGGRQEGAGREADVDVEVGGLAVDEEVVERLQATELVGAAGDRPARQHQRHARVLLPRCEVALVDDGEAHARPAPELAVRSVRYVIAASGNTSIYESARCVTSE